MLSYERVQRYKANLGTELKAARAKAGFTQKALASELGLEYYTMISQMELGYISIPTSLWLPICHVLKINSSEWVLRCLIEYQPDVYRSLFHNRSTKEVSRLLNSFHGDDLDHIVSSPKK